MQYVYTDTNSETSLIQNNCWN